MTSNGLLTVHGSTLTLWQHREAQNNTLSSSAVYPKTAHSNIPTPVPSSNIRILWEERICVSGKAIGIRKQINHFSPKTWYEVWRKRFFMISFSPNLLQTTQFLIKFNNGMIKTIKITASLRSLNIMIKITLLYSSVAISSAYNLTLCLTPLVGSVAIQIRFQIY